MATAVQIPASTRQITYADLYARWEKANWRATEIDFTQDRIDWRERLTDEQRRGMLWLFTLFFHGEDVVADTLSPYIDAAPREEQKYFLATQQVDEARHSVFFNRFMHEVAGLGDGTPGSGLAATESQLTWGHRRVFDHLEEVAADLRKHPTREKLTAAVTLYHMIVEASLAQPGQHMIEAQLEALDVLPGFREGMRNVSLDEQRHIAFGVKLLSDFYEEEPDKVCGIIVGKFREVMHWTVAVPVPPNWDRSYTESWGFTLEDLYEEGARTQEARLRAIGLPVDELVGFPMPMDVPPRERAQRGLVLLRNGLLGPRNGPAGRDREALEVFFDSIRRSADPSKAPEGTVIQWDFPDAEPWHLRLDNGSTSIEPGRAPDADVTLRVRFDDFVDTVNGRADPRMLMLRGRLRPRGSLRALVRLPRIFPS